MQDWKLTVLSLKTKVTSRIRYTLPRSGDHRYDPTGLTPTKVLFFCFLFLFFTTAFGDFGIPFYTLTGDTSSFLEVEFEFWKSQSSSRLEACDTAEDCILFINKMRL